MHLPIELGVAAIGFLLPGKVIYGQGPRRETARGSSVFCQFPRALCTGKVNRIVFSLGQHVQ